MDIGVQRTFAESFRQRTHPKQMQGHRIFERGRNLTHHIVGEGGESSAKAGKTSGSVIGTNLVPLKNILRYLPPLMHLVMGLANDFLKELKKDEM